MGPNDTSDIESYPLFKGITRVPLFLGVPVTPLILMIVCVALIAMWISLWCYLLILPSYIVMRFITMADDKAFRIVGLYIETKFRNANKRVWRSSSYSPIKYSKRRFEE